MLQKLYKPTLTPDVQSMALQKADSLQQLIAGRQQATAQSHLDKLDSLIAEQAQSIKVLEQLNTTANLALKQIRRHLNIIEKRSVKTEPSSVVATDTGNK